MPFNSWLAMCPRILILLYGALSLPGPAAFGADGSGVSIVINADVKSSNITGTAFFQPTALTFEQRLGYDLITLANGDYLSEPGRPMLPACTLRIALPEGVKITGLEIIATQTTQLTGEYDLFPAQPPRKVSDPTQLDFSLVDHTFQVSTAAYPNEVAQFVRQTDLAGQAIAVIQLFPVQYLPSDRQIIINNVIAFRLVGAADYRYGDYLSASSSSRATLQRVREVRRLVVNPDDVHLQLDQGGSSPARLLEQGNYEYVIIAKPDWVDDFQPLADWKTKKGTPATVISRGWIYDNYGGSTNQEKIRAFVQDAATTWGTMYFLLGGDTNTIPYQSLTIAGESIPNDTYYSDYDEDWTCEVYVGRAPVRGTAAIADFIAKLLTYEQNPPESDYAQTVLMLGFDLAEYGSNEGEGCEEDIRALYIPEDWTVRSEYDSEPGTHFDDSVAYLNQGHHLVNHIDHSGTDVMGVGSINHGEHLWTSTMSNLTNDGHFSIWYTIGCWPCDYPDDTCIGEGFIQNTSGGGVAFMGNSRSGWFNPYVYDSLSLRYDRFFFRGLFLYDIYNLGECFAYHKNHALQNSELSQFIFTELTLLGDPELSIWTHDPSNMTVTHQPILPTGEQPFTVHVQDAGGPLADATVCLWKDNEVYLTDTTGAAGVALFTPAAQTAGAMYVTVTKRNYKPYVGQADVGCYLGIETVGDGWVERIPDQTTYDYGQQVWLIAWPDPEWTFNRWSGDAEGNDVAMQITVIGEMNISAHFSDGSSDCPEDLDGDGIVGLADLAELLENYGPSGVGPEGGDFDSDNDVDLADLAQLISVYGNNCPTR